MTPVYPSSSFVEKEEDRNLKLYIFSSSCQASSSQPAPAARFTEQHDPRGNHPEESSHQLRHDHKAEKSLLSAGGSGDDCQVISSSSWLKYTVSSGNNEPREAFDGSRDDHQEFEDCSKPDNASAKNWMSSKMRLMQKMMITTNKKAAADSDYRPASNARIIQNLGNHQHGKWETRPCSSHNNGVRVCSDCNTTTTPLWRSGPQGPKSLCNACGIRQRKARRAMAEAANASSVVVSSDAPLGKQNKEKKCRTSCNEDDIVAHEKTKCSKVADNSSDSQSEGHVSFDNFTVSLSKSGSAFGRVFPRDEEEAAILLMELSCGLVHSC